MGPWGEGGVLVEGVEVEGDSRVWACLTLWVGCLEALWVDSHLRVPTLASRVGAEGVLGQEEWCLVEEECLLPLEDVEGLVAGAA